MVLQAQWFSDEAALDSLISVTEGRGKLLDAHTVEVTTSAGARRILKTKYILLAVGGKPVKAPIPGSVRSFLLEGVESGSVRVNSRLRSCHTMD